MNKNNKISDEKTKEQNKVFSKKKGSEEFCDEDLEEGRLFPGFLDGSTVSATESTGLIQQIPDTKKIQDIYDSVYSYRQKKAIEKEKEGLQTPNFQ